MKGAPRLGPSKAAEEPVRRRCFAQWTDLPITLVSAYSQLSPDAGLGPEWSSSVPGHSSHRRGHVGAMLMLVQ
jgi:hypothetical protein